MLPVRLKAFATFAALCLAASVASGGCQMLTPAKQVLFIGNSFTAFNGGIDEKLNSMTPLIHASSVTAGGSSLQDQLNAGTAVQRIRQEKWDYVVLQDQSQMSVIAPNELASSADQFNREVRARGAKTILFMTWERPDSVSAGVTTDNLAAAYQSVGTRLHVPVAPVGLAFAKAREEYPNFPLCSPDGHPTTTGTYLAACVFYGVILGKSPIDITDRPVNMPSGAAVAMRVVAAQTLGY